MVAALAGPGRPSPSPWWCSIWTRWGQYRPLRKCLVLSILAHLLLAGYATTVRIVALVAARRRAHRLHRGPRGPRGRRRRSCGRVSRPEGRGGLPRKPPAPLLAIPSQPSPAGAEARARRRRRAPARCRRPRRWPRCSTSRRRWRTPPPVPAIRSSRRVRPTSRLPPPPRPPIAPRPPRCRRGLPRAAGRLPRPLRRRRRPARRQQPMPDVYRLRMVPNHARLAEGHGGSPETEAAVQAALQWLADNQIADGHWSARQHEAGRDDPGRRPRPPHAGLHADSAMTGLGLAGLSRLGPDASRRRRTARRSAADWSTCCRSRRPTATWPARRISLPGCIRTPWRPSP